ncbi:hypothetical protein Ciccas_002266 [Cichlidogyrus casuarinus]|uniref:fumarate hydratase n=1 Tax=Cichlidogyrus casuarinus TaxID=1844966 RepID=A0ABD2QHQ5_9PLAT
MAFREDEDTLGTVKVPKDAHYGPQTQRSILNFDICRKTDLMPMEVIKSLVLLKLCASKINKSKGRLAQKEQEAIESACEEVLMNKHNHEFPLVIWQTGSGTQTNMNVNEVISSVANTKLGKDKGSKAPVHPNDHVNCGQSSNDIIPSAINVAVVISCIEYLLPKVTYLRDSLKKKQGEFENFVKIGRTHLQDAVPMTFGQELSGYIDQIDQNLDYIRGHLAHISRLALGGTAVGTGLNSFTGFDVEVCTELTELVLSRWRKGTAFFEAFNEQFLISCSNKLEFSPAINKFAALAGHDALLVFSGMLQSLATAFLKMASDFTLLASGPRCGFSEIILPANEPGSSIMPGKVNPTQCESMSMVAVQVMGNHQSVAIGASRGILELNVFKPLIASNLIHSIKLLADSAHSFAQHCVLDMQVNETKMREYTERSLMLVTALSPKIGYEKSAQLAKWAEANGKSLREAVAEFKFISLEQYDEIVNPKEMTLGGE